ncbi:MAG TPA: NAD(P)-dependent alcohol dehydrogenase [Sandaracinaceae bacterium LLY-WYZ-13_1]|nr:NAD(P)-dependent alcohol dehydrogenase [Sandaracinaceae bacterium LLY-WYZ-13_1]
MRAIVSPRYGDADVLELKEVPTPAPKAGEVRVRVHATTVGRTDRETLRGHPFFARLATGLTRPKHPVLGMDFAGVVEEVGPDAVRFAPGDRVFGLSPERFGAHADYLCVSEDGPVAPMPQGLRFDEAVVCEGAWYASTDLDAFGVGPGDRLLVYGASGAIGTAAVQLAKARGASVTAVVATRHLDLAASLGAERVVDYTAEDFTAIGETFDYVFDAVGKTSYLACRGLLTPDGVFAATDLGPWGQNVLFAWTSSLSGRGRVVFPLPKVRPGLVEGFAELLASGALRAVVDRTYPLEEIADAYRYVATEQKTGIVVVEVAPEP